MSTRQTNRRGVASAMCAEWPHMVSAIHLLAVTLPSTGFLLPARTPLLLPSMSLIALAISAIVALAAWCLSSDRHGAGTQAKSRQCIERRHKGNNGHVA